MPLTVTGLSENDVAALDKYAKAAGLRSRSAAIRQAIRLLGDQELEEGFRLAGVGFVHRRWRMGLNVGSRALRCCAVRSGSPTSTLPARVVLTSVDRPSLVSNDHAVAVAARLGRGVVTVVPLTSNTAHVYPFQVLMPAEATGTRVASKADALLTIDADLAAAAAEHVPVAALEHLFQK